MSNNVFNYSQFTTRNIGFVTQEEQEKLRLSCVFVCGVGGMGGACLLNLIRMGVSHFVFCDFDVFETSNLNRQVFATQASVGVGKVEATKKALLDINPDVRLETYGEEWPQHIDAIMQKVDMVVNGCDDVRATLLLYRKAKQYHKTVVDAYASPLPSVYTVKPEDPRPEETHNFPSLGKDLEAVTQEDIEKIVMCEAIYVMTHSSSARYIDLEIAAEYVAGKRSRMSLAPMVITTGSLMAYESLFVLLQKNHGTDYRGYFFNPYKNCVEKPLNIFWASIKRVMVKKFLNKLMQG